MNRFIFTGNLTTDPELKYLPSGVACCNFTLAVNRGYDREKTDFFRCTAFGKTAQNLVDYQKKGNKLLVTGEVHTSQKDDNYYTNFIVNYIEFLTPRNKQENTKNIDNNINNNNDNYTAYNNEPFNDPYGSPSEINDDDLPF